MSRKNNRSSDREDTSPVVFQSKKISEPLEIKERFKLTEKQQSILNCGLSKECKCLFLDGIWGSSKSYLATLISLKLLSNKRIDQIIYIRNPIEASTMGKIGFIKGDTSEKMLPYNQIFFDKLDELLYKQDIDKLNKENRFICLPLGFTRGLSWSCKAIIVDEAASMTYDDILLLLSRCGEFTKIFFIGDSLNQNDIGTRSGFSTIFKLFSDQESKDNGVFTFELKESSDIVRSGFVRFIMKKLGKISR